MKLIDLVFVYQMKTENELQWHGRDHVHHEHEFELHYFLQGDGSFRKGKSIYSINSGDLFISPPEERHMITASDLKKPLTYYALLFSNTDDADSEDFNSLLENLSRRNGAIRIGTNYRFFFEELKEKSFSHSSNQKRSAYYQFLSFLFSLADSKEDPFTGDEGNHHIEKALKIMQNQVFEYTSLDDIAVKLELAPSYFIRLFKKKMKTTPMKYYTRLKIEAAASLLINSDLPVYLIADRLKFSSEFHLSRQFKQYTGYAPSHYRNNFFQIMGES